MKIFKCKYVVYAITILFSILPNCFAYSKDIKILKEWYHIHVDMLGQRLVTNIFDIIQDEDGFLYFSTNQGVYRYDGFKFEFLNESINNYLGGSQIRFQNSRFFYENFDGHLFTFSNGNWKQFNTNNPIHFLFYGLFKNHLSYIQKDGIDIYDLSSSSLKHTIKYPVGYPQYTTQSDKYYYLINEHTIAKFDDEKLVSEFQLQNVVKNEAIRLLFYNNHLLYAIPRSDYMNGIIVLDADLNFKYSIQIKNLTGIINNVKFIDNKIWILTTTGIHVYREVDNKLVFERKQMSGLSVTNLIKGKNGEYWISTLGKGLYLIPNPNRFVFSFENEKLSHITTHKNGYLIGTNSGRVIVADKNLSKAQLKLRSIHESPITYIFKSKFNTDLFYVSGVGFDYISSDKHFFYDKALKSITQLDSKYYALATSSDILLFRSKFSKNIKSSWDSIFEKRNFGLDYISINNSKRSKAIAYYENLKRIYFLTNIGLFYIDENGQEHEVLNDSKPIVAERIYFLNEKLYILGFNGNLWEYNHSELMLLKNITSPILNFKGFNEDIILKTANGFQLYNTRTKQVRVLKTNLQSYSINDFTSDSLGNVLATTHMGIIPLLDDIDIRNSRSNSFKLTKVYINGESQNIKNSYRLAHDENNIQIHFAYLDFSDPNPPSFSYRLNNGLWESLPSGSQNLQFHELASGSYDVDIQMDNGVILYNMQLVIDSPFWQTWLFYILLCFVVFIVVYGYFTYKRKILRNEILLLEDKIKLEKELGRSILTSVKAQMNPHFFFNALNSIQAFMYKNDNKQAINYLSKFSKLTRLILTQTDLEHIRLSDEVNMLKLYLDLESLRSNHTFIYNFSIDKEIDSNVVYLPPMLIQPYVENCIKHGFMITPADAQINIHFEVKNIHLIVKIMDNGIGLKKAIELRNSESNSFSSNANQRRLDILNKALNIDVSVRYDEILDSKQNCVGTSVTLHIPIKINYENI